MLHTSIKETDCRHERENSAEVLKCCVSVGETFIFSLAGYAFFFLLPLKCHDGDFRYVVSNA